MHRLYVKAALKRTGSGTALLDTAENWTRSKGIAVSKVHPGAPQKQWVEAYNFYPKRGYTQYAVRYMMKKL